MVKYGMTIRCQYMSIELACLNSAPYHGRNINNHRCRSLCEAMKNPVIATG